MNSVKGKYTGGKHNERGKTEKFKISNDLLDAMLVGVKTH